MHAREPKEIKNIPSQEELKGGMRKRGCMETAHKCFTCKNLKNLGHLALPTLLYTEQPETFCSAASTLAPARRRCLQEEGGGAG